METTRDEALERALELLKDLRGGFRTRNTGKPRWTPLAAKLQEEGFTQKGGGPISWNAVRGRVQRFIDEAGFATLDDYFEGRQVPSPGGETEGADAQAIRGEDEEGESSERSEEGERRGGEIEPTKREDERGPDVTTPEKRRALPESWLADIRDIVRDIVREEREAMQPQQAGPMERVYAEGVLDMPPRPDRVDGRKVRGESGFAAKRYEGQRGKLSGTVDQALLDRFREAQEQMGITSISRMMDVVLWNALGKPPMSFELEESETSEESEE